MPIGSKNNYRKNSILITVFILMFSGIFLLLLFLSYNFSRKRIEKIFFTERVNVLDRSLASYSDFLKTDLPSISEHKGLLDSAKAAKFSADILKKYSFVSFVNFYDVELKNAQVKEGVNLGAMSISPNNIYRYSREKGCEKVFSRGNSLQFLKYSDDFLTSALKTNTCVEQFSRLHFGKVKYTFDDFLHVQANKIICSNVPENKDLIAYKRMMGDIERVKATEIYQQDVFSFQLNAQNIEIININPELYEYVEVHAAKNEFKPKISKIYLITETDLSGPFSGYKLVFYSSQQHLQKAIYAFFYPIALILFFLYGVFVLITVLIFKNININRNMYKLQYDFVNNLTHEFKTPVSVIKIAGSNIKSSQSITHAEQMMYGKILEEEADKLNGLMNKLLSFTQIENKRININSCEVNVVEFIESTIDSYCLKYSDFDFTYSFSGFPTFFTDPILLGSLFDNLSDNAYKYSPKNLKKLHISAKVTKSKVIFNFEDKGIGIPAAQIKNVFKKFYRIQNDYNQTGSAGLGLAFCKELITFMKGEITVKSKENIGTTFTIKLPYNI
ncbi:MAG: HAMP domain-containing histidine kinase [Sphingobacteriaceae bacterium]|nr:HAMP domain-containing histidine kinase [Sphingobacteriaceae bacterium]